MNQNQSWNLSLEGAWNSTTVNGITENRTFNEVYEILTSNSNPLTHDRKGNLTQNKDASQYTWDYNNQLSHAVNASSENASYTYDALGRRISKQVVGTLTVYINIGYQIATEYQSTDGINFTEKQSYVYATYIDDPLALIKASGERFYYHSNGQFSISKITDEYKNVVEAYAYNAYGDVQILQSYNSNLDNPYYFTGRQLDSETGLFYFRARYYDAKLGQFISRDPIGYVDGMNLYRGYFVVNGADPFGKLSLQNVHTGVMTYSGGPQTVGDGVVSWKTRFVLDSNEVNGFVYQYISITVTYKDCDGNILKESKFKYEEMWPVSDGSFVGVGAHGIGADGIDTFDFNEGNLNGQPVMPENLPENYCVSVVYFGLYHFFQQGDLTLDESTGLPPGFAAGNVPEAGQLISMAGGNNLDYPASLVGDMNVHSMFYDYCNCPDKKCKGGYYNLGDGLVSY